MIYNSKFFVFNKFGKEDADGTSWYKEFEAKTKGQWNARAISAWWGNLETGNQI